MFRRSGAGPAGGSSQRDRSLGRNDYERRLGRSETAGGPQLDAPPAPSNRAASYYGSGDERTVYGDRGYLSDMSSR